MISLLGLMIVAVAFPGRGVMWLLSMMELFELRPVLSVFLFIIPVISFALSLYYFVFRYNGPKKWLMAIIPIYLIVGLVFKLMSWPGAGILAYLCIVVCLNCIFLLITSNKYKGARTILVVCLYYVMVYMMQYWTYILEAYN